MFDDTDLHVLGQLEPQEQIRHLLNERSKLNQQVRFKFSLNNQINKNNEMIFFIFF